jgi:hypothetical protein
MKRYQCSAFHPHTSNRSINDPQIPERADRAVSLHCSSIPPQLSPAKAVNIRDEGTEAVAVRV